MTTPAFIGGIWDVARREIRRVASDTNIVLVILAAPLLYALFYGSIYLHKSEYDVPITVVDCDRGELSRRLIRDLDAHPYIEVDAVTSDFEQARQDVDRLKSSAIVYIPESFETSLERGTAVEITAYLNASRFLIGNDLNKAITEVTATLAAQVKVKTLLSRGYSADKAKAAAEPLQADVRWLFNPSGTYGNFFLPGLLVLVLQQTLLIGLAESVAGEREKGTVRDWYLTAGRHATTALLGKGCVYLALYGAYTVFFLAIVFPLFKLPMGGDMLALALLTVLFFACITFLSILISSWFRNEMVALEALALTSIPFILWCGFSWPVQAMPPVMQWGAQLLPITPYLSAFTRITLMGAGWQDTLGAAIHLAALGLILFVMCVIRVRGLAAKAERDYEARTLTGLSQ
jgi:ABC-2 type transport system permease protein